MERTKGLLAQLGKSQYDRIPEDIVKRLDKIFDESHSKVADLKSRFNESQKTTEKLRKDLQTSTTEKANLVKLHSTSKSNVADLRQQLTTANDEITLLSERIKSEEKQNEDWRKQRDDLVRENDQLKDISGRKDALISTLQLEQKSYQQQFELEMFENDEAKKNIAEMAQQQHLMMNNELELRTQVDELKKEIVKLTDQYKEQTVELTAAVQDKTSATAQLENDLKARTDELSAANCTIRHLTESIQSSTNQCDGQSIRLKNQLNESTALIEHYKRELDANIKLADLHKANFDECQTQNKLETDSLNLALEQTTQKFEMLESTINNMVEQHHLELTELNATIEKLNDELQEAGKLLKTAETERAEKVLETLFPRAATSNRMLKDNSTLTEIFSRYNDSLDEAHRLELECLHTNARSEILTMKLQDTTSELERLQIEYRKILKQNNDMTEQMDAVTAEQSNLHETLTENSLRLAKAESENAQLKCTQKDLARQICNLLNKVEVSGNQPTSDQVQLKRLGLSSETIRKELITFDNIAGLQENNQKLMLKIRELSSKVEKLEEQNIKLKSCEQNISYLERQVSDGETSRLANEDLLAMTTRQKDRFKQLYFDAMNYMGKQISTEEEENAPMDISQSTAQQPTADRKDKRLIDVELKLQEKVKELKVLKEEHNEYRKQATINFDMLKQECESVERKVSELISDNSRLRSQESFTTEQMKSHRNDIVIYKKQIQVLEERNQMYDKTIAKHESANNQMKQRYWNLIVQLSTAQNRCSYLEMECRRLTEANKNLGTENSALHRQNVTQSLLENSRDLAIISSERSDFEGRIKLERLLEQKKRQCEVLKRKLEEEQIRYKEENNSLKRQRDSGIKKLSDKQAQAESLQVKYSETREQLEAKVQHIKNLNEKLQEAIAVGNSAACLSKQVRSSKELEAELNNKNAEIQKLSSELEELTTKTKLFDRLKSNWEAEKNGLKRDLQACKLSESNSKSHINELQSEIRILSTQNSGVELENMRAENKKASETIIESNKKLQDVRRQYQQLKENMQVVETNYADVLSVRSLELQMVTGLRTELSCCQEQMEQLKSAKIEADESKNEIQMKWEATSKKLIDDRQQLEQNVATFDKQTLELVAMLQAKNGTPSSNETLNESLADISMMNRTLTDEEIEKFSSAKLFGVVKYLRREKDIAATQIEVLTIENTRLSAELDMLKNQLNELSDRLNSTETLTPSNDNVGLSAECEKIHRDAATLSAATDSNILLREENKGLCHRVEDLDEKVVELEADLLRLQNENHKLVESKAQTIYENKILRASVDSLKAQGDCLESNLKQLTTEKENQGQSTEEVSSLIAELIAEKEKQRQATEEINLMKAEKSRLKQEIESKSKHIQTLADDRKKMLQKISKQEEVIRAQQKGSAEVKTGALKTDEKLPNIQQNLIPSKIDHVTSSETVSSATESLLKRQPSGLKRFRDNDAVRKFDTKVSSASSVEKVSPQSKRARLQRGCENVPKSNVDENIDAQSRDSTLDDEEALLPGAQPIISVDGDGTGIGGNETQTAAGADTYSEVESVDSGRLSTDFTVEPEDFQLGRIRRAPHIAAPVRRGRSRLYK